MSNKSELYNIKSITTNLTKFFPILISLLILMSIPDLTLCQDNVYENLVKQHRKQIEEPREIPSGSPSLNRDPISPLVVGRFLCDPGIKLNTVRQDVMNSKNYHKVMYRYKHFLLYVSATWCDYCCQHEKELLGVKQMLLDKTVDGEDIPIVQLHADTDLEVLKELKVGFFKVPSLYLVREKQFIQYNSFFKAENILRWMNNIFNPVVELHSVEDVERFMDTTKNFQEKNDFLGDTVLNIPESTDHDLRIRFVGFFSDLEDYSAEYSQFVSLAEKISNRPDLRIGIVTDKEIVRHFKQVYEGIWFNSHSWNSLVLKRVDKYFFLDLSLLNEQLEVFMVYNTIPFIDELNNNNNFITSKIATPVALFFIDSVYILENYHAQLKFLANISKDYIGKYVFMFMDGNSKTQSKEALGLKKDTPMPTLVVNYLQSGKQKQLPYDAKYNDHTIIRFLNENFFSKLSGTDLEDLKEKNIKSYDDKIVKNLKLATKIEKKNFDKIINNKKYDVVVFVVDTDYDKTSENLSKYINKISERFKSLGIKSVLLSYYDINENGLFIHQGVNYVSGDILIFPANSKQMEKFKENVTLLRLMKWVEKLSEVRIRLPEIPHIDLEMQEEYYKKKAILESYDENMSKTDIEIDDLLNMEFESYPSSSATHIKSEF